MGFHMAKRKNIQNLIGDDGVSKRMSLGEIIAISACHSLTVILIIIGILALFH